MNVRLASKRWLKQNLGTILIAILALLSWEIYSRFYNPYGNLYFPSIAFTIEQTLEYSDGVIAGFKTTILEILLGYVFAVIIGVGSGIAMAKSTAIRYSSLPYAVYLYALPAAIVAPLFVVWAPSYFTAAVFFVGWVAFFAIFINTLTGFQEIDEEYYQLAELYDATTIQILVKIEFWQAMPHIRSGLKIGVQQAIVGAIVIEFIATTGGIGYLLVTALELLRPGLLFGVLILIILFSISFYKTVTMLIDIATPGPS